MINSSRSPLYKTLLATPDEVSVRIRDLATDVIAEYRTQSPLFVCLLRGGAPFAMQLMRDIAIQDQYFHPEMDYMTVSTYASERTDSEPVLVMGLAPHTVVAGRRVVLLDDTLDKGVTADFARQELRKQGAADVDLIVLVDKQRPREDTFFVEATMAGFRLGSDVWLTGMGLDDARIAKEANRWTGYVAAAIDEVS